MSAAELARANRILDAHVSAAEILAYLRDDHYLSKTSASRYIDHRTPEKIETAIRLNMILSPRRQTTAAYADFCEHDRSMSLKFPPSPGEFEAGQVDRADSLEYQRG